MLIKTSRVNRRNLKVQLMDEVIVHFNEELIGDLKEEDKLEAILVRDSSISLVEESKETKKEVKNVAKEKVEEVATEEATVSIVEEAKEIEKEEVEAKLGLEDLKVSELQELCQEAKLPEEEWKNLKKTDLISYVKKYLEK